MAVDGISSEASFVAERQSLAPAVTRVHWSALIAYFSGLNCQAVTGTVLTMWYAPLSTRDEALRRPPEVLASENSGPFSSGIHLSITVSRPPGITVTSWCKPAGPSMVTLAAASLPL